MKATWYYFIMPGRKRAIWGKTVRSTCGYEHEPEERQGGL